MGLKKQNKGQAAAKNTVEAITAFTQSQHKYCTQSATKLT